MGPNTLLQKTSTCGIENTRVGRTDKGHCFFKWNFQCKLNAYLLGSTNLHTCKTNVGGTENQKSQNLFLT